jgi:hypothetical protein
MGGWEIEGGEFGHLLRGGIVDAADQHADMAQGTLLGDYAGVMLPQAGPVPAQNLTQRLFALPILV